MSVIPDMSPEVTELLPAAIIIELPFVLLEPKVTVVEARLDVPVAV